MALVAHRVLDRAVEVAGTADVLAAQMEPHLQKRYGNSAIYAYTNRRAIPPGDVLLAAALAAGISLDDELHIGRQATEAERQLQELRAEMAQLRDTVAGLQLRLDGQPAPAAAEQPDLESARRSRASARDAWARRSTSGQPPVTPPASRQTGSRRPV
jgi:hypothetical protein